MAFTKYIDPDGTIHYQRTVVLANQDEAAKAREIIRENMDVIVDKTGAVPAVIIESTDPTKVLIAVAVASARGGE